MRYTIICGNNNSAVINELELYNVNNDKISYDVIYNKAYDSNTGAYPYYWTNENYWNYTNLYDGNTEYTSNTQGGQNATSFTYNSSAGAGKWARFIIYSSEYPTKFRFSIGNSANERTPKEISVFEISEYTEDIYNNNVKQRNNEGITLFGNLQFDSNVETPTWFEVNR